MLRQVDARLNAAPTRDTELARQFARASVGAGPESAGASPDLATVRAVLDNVRQELDAIAFAPTQQADTMSVLPVVTPRMGLRRLKARVAEVVSAAVGGERHAVAELLARVRPIVVRYCRVRLGGTARGSFAAADDVAQEVCVIVLGALSRYRDKPEKFLTFVYGVAARKVADHRRRSAVRDLPSDGPDDASGDDVSQDVAAQPAAEPAASDLAARLNDLLDVLPPVQREVVMLRIIVGLSADETATALGITPGAVRVTQHRALARLRKSLDTSEHIHAD